MSRIVKLILFLACLPFLYLAAAFVASNMQLVQVRLWPFEIGYELPLAALVYIVLLLGFVIGATAAWIGAGRVRRAKRRAEAQRRAQARKIDELKRRLDEDAKTAKLAAPDRADPQRAIAGNG